MPKVIARIAAGAATASVVVVVVLVRPVGADSTPSSAPAPVSTPAHGDFHKRLQPKLDGIGSTRDLRRVALRADSAAKRHVQKQ